MWHFKKILRTFGFAEDGFINPLNKNLMENTTSLWKSSVQKAFYGFIAFTVGGFLSGIASAVDRASSMASFMDGELSLGPSAFSIIASLIVIAGYVYYFIGINGMKKSLTGTPDFLAANNLYLGVLLGLIGSVVALIPFIGFLGTLCSFVGFIFMMIAFNKMKVSTTLPASAVSGSSKLFVSMLLALIGGVLGLIPIAGGILEAIMSIIVLIFGFMGWSAIAKSELQESNPAQE